MAKKREFRSKALKHVYDRHVGDDREKIQSFEDEVLNARLARQLYELRKSAGLSQEALAQKVGTSRSVISRLEDADYDGHSLSMIRRIAEALDRSVEVRFVSKDQSELRA